MVATLTSWMAAGIAPCTMIVCGLLVVPKELAWPQPHRLSHLWRGLVGHLWRGLVVGHLCGLALVGLCGLVGLHLVGLHALPCVDLGQNKRS